MKPGTITSGQKLAGIFLITFAFILNLTRSDALGLGNKPSSIVVNGIPAYISIQYFGQRHDYTQLRAVAKSFFEHLGSWDGPSVDKALAIAKNLEPAKATALGYELLGTDDKGLVDYVSLAFFAFGERSSSFLWLYFAVLGLSGLLFSMAFSRMVWPLYLLAFVLLAHWTVMVSVPANPQLTNLYATRFIPTLSLIAFLHVLLFLKGAENVSLPSSALAFLQALLLLGVFHVRSTVLSQIVVLVLFGIGVIIKVLVFARHAGVLNRHHLLGPIFVVVLLATAPTFQSFYYRERLAAEYFVAPNIPKHVMWHNVLSGFALSPTLQRAFGFKIDDVSTIQATGNWLISQGRQEEWRAMGGESPGFAAINWQPYDSACKDMVFALLKTRPFDIFWAIIYWKPLAFWQEVRWLSTPQKDYPHSTLLYPAHNQQMPGVRANLLLNPFEIVTIPVVVTVLIGAFSLAFCAGQSFRGRSFVCFVFVATATAPILVGYPLLHTMGESLVAVLSVLYFSVSSLGAALLRRSAATWAAPKGSPEWKVVSR